MSYLYDADPHRVHAADNMDVGRGGGAVALEGLPLDPRCGEGEGRGGGQQVHPGAQTHGAA